MNFWKIVFALIICVAANPASSQSMTLALEGDEWASVKEYPVKGKDGIFKKESLAFGDFKSVAVDRSWTCLLYTSPSPRDRTRSRMPSSA